MRLLFAYMVLQTLSRVLLLLSVDSTEMLLFFFSFQVAHRIHEWMAKELQTCFRKDIECPNHNTWMINCKFHASACRGQIGHDYQFSDVLTFMQAMDHYKTKLQSEACKIKKKLSKIKVKVLYDLTKCLILLPHSSKTKWSMSEISAYNFERTNCTWINGTLHTQQW